MRTDDSLGMHILTGNAHALYRVRLDPLSLRTLQQLFMATSYSENSICLEKGIAKFYRCKHFAVVDILLLSSTFGVKSCLFVLKVF